MFGHQNQKGPSNYYSAKIFQKLLEKKKEENWAEKGGTVRVHAPIEQVHRFSGFIIT